MSETLKEKNYALVEKVVTSPWWEPKYAELLDPNMTLELPFAPPGMCQNLGRGQLWAHKTWMTKTVHNWDVSVRRIYGPKKAETGIYFAMIDVRGDVHWADTDGVYENYAVLRVTVKNGKVVNIKEWSNPFKYYAAIHVTLPTFYVKIPEKAVVKAVLGKKEQPVPVYPADPESVAQRARDNYRSMVTSDHDEMLKMTTAPGNFKRIVFYVPPEMQEEYSSEEAEIMESWTNASMDTWQLMDDAIGYELDDPNAFFFETGGYGQWHWEGNNACGGYYNRYLKFITLDDQGLMTQYHEYLNPVNKMNSINKQIPTFPWLY